ncbi:MAG: acyloxyacyl hydrolase [Syntrophales bacterium]|nr:acyloxyacyl hydrolase [Syntrophales bacterium]
MRFGAFLNACVALTVLTIPVAADRVGAEVGQACFPVSESGVVMGYGAGDIEEGKCRPLLMIWHVGFNLKEFSPGQSEARGNAISFFLEPQVNPVVTPSTDVEFGIGIGLKYMHYITDRLSIYCMASVGPHWMTLQTESQANGFVFSDMAGVGLLIFLTYRSALNMEFRARHLSNASLAEPNGGVNSCFGAVGYSVFF